jgi:hypothetical protein
VVADPSDRDTAAALAFVSAVLAVDYGLDTTRETEAAAFDVHRQLGPHPRRVRMSPRGHQK